MRLGATDNLANAVREAAASRRLRRADLLDLEYVAKAIATEAERESKSFRRDLFMAKCGFPGYAFNVTKDAA